MSSFINSCCLIVILLSSHLHAANLPDMVVMLADDWSYRDTSIAGSTEIRTPNVERLAAVGLSFERAFVASPSCASSRASLLTGLMPARHGAEANHSKPHSGIKKLPSYLQTLGYEVVAFGKVSHYKHTAFYGFDHFANDAFHEDVAVANAVTWLKNRKSEKPLCLFVGTNWPHVPWPAQPEGYDPAKISIPENHVDTPETRMARANYYTAVTKADTHLGTVYDTAMEVLGQDTLFLFTTDHGSQWPFAKWNCYDDGIHVPMIISWPGHISAGSQSKAMVSWIDILPTLIDVAGGQPPRDIDGRSFYPVLTGMTNHHRDRIFTTHSGDGNMNVYPIRSVLENDWLYIRNLHPEFKHTTHIDLGNSRDGVDYFQSWTLAAHADSNAEALIRRYHSRPKEELYNLKADPWQKDNLASESEHQAILEDLRGKLNAWMFDQRDAGTVYGEPKPLKNVDLGE